MWARAMLLEGTNGERAAVVVLDLMSASRHLHDQIAAAAGPRFGIGRERLIVCGTHTHTGPAGFYGNRLYDTFVAHDPMHGFDGELAELLVKRAVDALERAVHDARPATVRVDVERVWGVSHNRSADAFRENEDWLHWTSMSNMPGHAAPAHLSEAQRWVDPRVVVLSAFDAAGSRFGVFATFACHNTALGPRGANGAHFYDPDWTGVAARLAESRSGDTLTAMVALSGAGDQSPMAVRGGAGPVAQGPERAEWVGDQIAQAITRVGWKGASGATPPVVRVVHSDWWTAPGGPDPAWAEHRGARLAPWAFGASSLAGAEDGRSPFHPDLVWEGMKGDDYPPSDLQHPKQKALGLLQDLLRCGGDLRPSPVHAVHVLRVGDHAFATVPGEPTVWVAHEIEQALRDLSSAPSTVTASVLGYAGDYAGYFTTRGEFRAQHYEGSSTLFGRESAEHLVERLRTLARDDATAPPPAPPPTERATPAALPLPPPAPYGYRHPEGVVALWTFAREGAPTRFDARAVMHHEGAARVLDDSRLRVQPRDLRVGASLFTAWIVNVRLDAGVEGDAVEVVTPHGTVRVELAPRRG